MFRRRDEASFTARLSASLARKNGLWRMMEYWHHRTLRIPGTPESVARGLACGVAVSFTPLIGLHTPLALGLAYVLRGNVIASALASAVGNPLTFYFIFWLVHHVGGMMLGLDGAAASYSALFASALEAPWSALTDNSDRYWDNFFLPIFVGFVPTAVSLWFMVYALSLRLIRRYQTLRRQRLARAAMLRGGTNDR